MSEITTVEIYGTQDGKYKVVTTYSDGMYTAKKVRTIEQAEKLQAEIKAQN